MRVFFVALCLVTSFFSIAQETGSIVGKLTDKEMNNNPLAFANVLIKGTVKGTTSDFDGLYEIANVEAGTYIIQYSYVGYKTIEIPNVTVIAGKVTTINVSMSAEEGMQLDEVVITTSARKDSETALLLDQKKAIEIKESIGAVELTKIGISNAAAATTKISGVSSSEASGDVFVRGLGDRYLSTTLNGLAVPSDDVEKKNIDLSLFPTRVIQNVSISKTYSAKSTADQTSGDINIATRELKGLSELSIGVSSGINSNVAKSGVWDNFRVTQNSKDISWGYHRPSTHLRGQILGQGWNTVKQQNPMNVSASLTVGKKFADKVSVLFTGSHSRSFDYREGVFRQYRSNFVDDTITDATTYNHKIVSTGLLDVVWSVNDKHKLKSSTFVINKINESVFEGGRNGEATIFEETQASEGLFQFIRDQNTKQTSLLVTQLLGTHRFGEKNKIMWAAGLNNLNADEPNRIRNEVNFDPDGTLIQLGRNGGFQQRKSSQLIKDVEYNGYIKDVLQLIDEDEKSFKIEAGLSYRKKERDFSSEFVGVEETSTNAVNPVSLDNLSGIFHSGNFNNGLLELNLLGSNANGERKDIYTGALESMAAYADFNASIEKWNFNAGLRFQKDKINVGYDIGNLFPRVGESNQEYNNLYPSINIKYSLNENQALRLAMSSTITLPEFKEVSPFEYVSPTGQVTRGNVDLEASRNLNYDLKWEYFPSAGELVSVSAFYKDISDPINRVRDRGSAGVYSYFNSGNKAEVFGLEAETKLKLIKPIENEDGDKSGYGLDVVFNATRMWHKQDLKDVRNDQGSITRTFKYKDLTKTDLQGASDWILNTSLNFKTAQENPFAVSLTANYASDKIFALGVPTDQSNKLVEYDDAIVEKGFVVLNTVVSKDLGKHWNLKLIGKNLLNPTIKQTQNILQNQAELIANPNASIREVEKTVLSYKTGSDVSLSIGYKF